MYFHTISPVAENVIVKGRPWWERYQPVSYNLTTRSGSESQLSDMISRCNKVGIRIYADVIFNHMAAFTGIGTAGNKAMSDDKIYPGVPYTPEDFHPTCNIPNYLDPEVVRNCELNNLRDLDQSTQNVQLRIVTYLNKLIGLGVAGFRVDSAKYIATEQLEEIYSKLNDLNTSFFPPKTRPFIYQDVPVFGKKKTHNFVEIFRNYSTELGNVLESRFSPAISRVFSGKDNLTNLQNWGPDWGFIPTNDSVVFVDSHNNQRNGQILNYQTLKQYKMALAFMLSHPYGLPRIISSYFFHNKDVGPPQDSDENVKSPIIYSDGSCGNGFVCEHRWPQVRNMVDFRNAVSGTEIGNWWSNNEQQIAFSRGSVGFIAFANGGNLTEKIQTGLAAGTYCDIISGSLVNKTCTGKSVVVDGKGVASVRILESDFEGVVAVFVNSKK
ncbi:LOW QUALITY PROTEIN: alpha-amylase [Tribolium castaneum]|uniref:LOW QUALITY PROTEIN: alpha-amylase n=1 Tax=Tribolium castaneum TaxID=7070 RepID=UPI0030FE33F0